MINQDHSGIFNDQYNEGQFQKFDLKVEEDMSHTVSDQNENDFSECQYSKGKEEQLQEHHNSSDWFDDYSLYLALNY